MNGSTATLDSARVLTPRWRWRRGAIASYHTGVDEVAKIAARADAKALALTHFVPPLFDKQQLLADLRPHYNGPVIIAEDLMRISLPDRSIDAGGVVLGY